MDPGINKPFDRIAKELAEEAPLLFLRILGIAPMDAVLSLDPLRPETAPPVTLPDFVASLSIDGAEPRTLHVEFLLHYRADAPATVARYGGSLAWQYRRPVTSILLMLQRGGVPDIVPEVGEYSIGETTLRHPFRTVRLWELDPEPVLATEDPALFPWALLMRLGREQAEQLGAQVGRSGNEQWIARFLTLGGLRYPRVDLERMIGGPTMGLAEAIVEGSSIFVEAREKAEAEARRKGEVEGRRKGEVEGRRKGEAEGRREGEVQGRIEGRIEGQRQGQVEGARRLIRLALADRFPGLEVMPELDRIDNAADLETLLLKHVMRSDDRIAVEKAIVETASHYRSPRPPDFEFLPRPDREPPSE